MSDPDELVRKICDAVNARDPDRLAELTHPDFRFESVIAGSEGRDYRGREGLQQFFDDIAETFKAFAITVEGCEMRNSETLLVSLTMRAKGRSSGVPIVQPVWQVWTYEDGSPWRNQAFLRRDEAIRALDSEK